MACFAETPDLPPQSSGETRHEDETSWPVGVGRWAGAYLADDGNWEVLHVGFRFGREHGVYVHREHAEVVAEALAAVLTAAVTL